MRTVREGRGSAAADPAAPAANSIIAGMTNPSVTPLKAMNACSKQSAPATASSARTPRMIPIRATPAGTLNRVNRAIGRTSHQGGLGSL